MPSVTVELTTDLQQLNLLVDAKRSADNLPPIPSYGKVNRITGGGAGLVIVSRSPLPTTSESYRLANNEATPIYADTIGDRHPLNSFWLRGEAGGEFAHIDIGY